jgi:hypothetical protein
MERGLANRGAGLALGASAMKKIGLDRFDVLTCAVLLLSYAAIWRLPFGTPKLGDVVFHAEAKTLARVIRGLEPWSVFGMSRAPAPVLYYVIPYLTVPPGSSDDRYWQAGFVWTIGWMLVALLLLRRIGRRLGGELTGKLVIILMLVTPFWAYYSYGILAESPAFLGVVVFLYAWLRWQESAQRQPPGREGAALVYAGLSFFLLCRPNALLLLGFAALAAIWMYRTNTAYGIRAAKFTVSVVAVVCLVIAGTTIVVRSLPRSSQITYFWWQVFQGAYQYRTEPWNWNYWDKAHRKGTPDYDAWYHTYKDLSREAKEARIPGDEVLVKWLERDILDHPMLWARMAAIRTLAFHSSFVNSQKPEAFRVGPISGRVVYAAFHLFVNLVNLILFVGAVWFMITHRSQWAFYWPLWGPWISLVLFHTVVYSEPRYFFPLRPCLTAMAAVSLTPFVGRVLAWLQSRTVSPPLISAQSPAERSA